MIREYTRREPGKHYLESILSQLLSDITLDESLNLEIDPVKVYAYLVNKEEMETGQKVRLCACRLFVVVVASLIRTSL